MVARYDIFDRLMIVKLHREREIGDGREPDTIINKTHVEKLFTLFILNPFSSFMRFHTLLEKSDSATIILPLY